LEPKISLGLATFIQEHESQLFNLNTKIFFIENNEENNIRRELIRDWFLAKYNLNRLQTIVEQNEDFELVFNASWALGILEKYIS